MQNTILQNWIFSAFLTYIVIHRQICFVLSELISAARRYLPRSWDRNPVDLNAKPKLLTSELRGDIRYEVNFKRLWITITIVYIHPFNGRRDLNSNAKRHAKALMATRLLLIYILACVCVCVCVLEEEETSQFRKVGQ